MSPSTDELKRRRVIAGVVGVILVGLIVALSTWINGRTDDSGTADASADRTITATGTRAATSKAPTENQQIPARVRRTLDLIDAGRWPAAANAPGTKGGIRFRNSERRLPTTDDRGKAMSYQEWDVNPKQRGRGRDAERIITAADGSAWYTLDHYRTFVLIRGPSQ